jgi:hypothetical protein
MVKKKLLNRFSDPWGFVFEPLVEERLAEQKNARVVVNHGRGDGFG